MDKTHAIGGSFGLVDLKPPYKLKQQMLIDYSIKYQTLVNVKLIYRDYSGLFAKIVQKVLWKFRKSSK